MSQSTRTFGTMIATLTINSVSYIAVCQNFEIQGAWRTGQAEALLDEWDYPVGLRRNWQGTGDFFISTANTSGEGGPGGTLWTLFLDGAQVPVVFKDNAVSGAGNTFNGNALIEDIRQRMAIDPVVVTITLRGQGALTSSIA